MTDNEALEAVQKQFGSAISQRIAAHLPRAAKDMAQAILDRGGVHILGQGPDETGGAHLWIDMIFDETGRDTMARKCIRIKDLITNTVTDDGVVDAYDARDIIHAIRSDLDELEAEIAAMEHISPP